MIRGNTRCNMSAITLFSQSLDGYESSLPTNIIEPSMFSESCRNFEMALNRLVSANPCDAYQMMRDIMSRILEKRKGFDDYFLLMIATASQSGTFKDQMMAIVYPLVEMVKGTWGIVIDEVYFNRLGRNEGIRNFMVNYETSDLRLLYGTLKNNVVTVCDDGPDVIHQDDLVNVTLGSVNSEIILTGGLSPIVRFSVSNNLTLPSTHDSNLPTVISTTVIISPRGTTFSLEPSIRFTTGALELAKQFGCIQPDYRVSQAPKFTVPNTFFSCKLYIISPDGGNTWIIGNIQILTPRKGKLQ